MGNALRMKNDLSGVAPHPTESQDATNKFIENPRLDIIVSALALATLDEINAIRQIALLGPLPTLTATQWEAKIRAKIPV